MPRNFKELRRHYDGAVTISIAKADRVICRSASEDLPRPRKQKPPHSKKLTNRKDASTVDSVVTAVATADSYKFRELKRYFQPARGQILDTPDVVCIHFPAYGGQVETWIFFFQYGVTVWWGSEIIGRQILAQVKPFEIKSEKEIDFERCEFSYNSPTPQEGAMRIVVDHIYLENKSVEQKLAFSHGLAQSAKLTTFEDRIEDVISTAQRFPGALQEGGTVSITKNEAARLMGTLFIHRMNVNLHTDILDTPKYFWEHGELKPIYFDTRYYMDIDQRVEVLNQRLQIVENLFTVIHQELNTRHFRHLEWVVLCLFFVDIFLAVASVWCQLRHSRYLPFL
jgi:uncharacterized Rmd1/YagE family protein